MRRASDGDRHPDGRTHLTRPLVTIGALALTALTGLLLAWDGPWAGPVMFSVSDSHGLHVGDVPVIALWATSMAACAALWAGRGA